MRTELRDTGRQGLTRKRGGGAREGGTPWNKTSPKKQKESLRGALHHRQGSEYRFSKTGAQIETIKWCWKCQEHFPG